MVKRHTTPKSGFFGFFPRSQPGAVDRPSHLLT